MKKIIATDSLIDEEVQNIQARYGKMSSLDEIIEGANVTATFVNEEKEINKKSTFLIKAEDVEKAKKSSRSKAAFLNHLTGIRGRIHVCDFSLTKDEHWGWISDVILNTDCLHEFDATVEEKCEVLDYLWKNWFDLKEKSIRLVEKMFSIKRIYIDSYEKVWDFDYLKKKIYEK